MLGGLLSINAIQAQDELNVIKDYLSAQRNVLNLTQEDINDPVLKSSSFSKSMRVQVAYVNQALQGVEVHNSTSRFAIKDQQVYSARIGFISDLGSKVNTTSPSISAETAVRKAAQSFGLTPASIEVLSAQGHDYLISAAELSQNDIPVSLVFQKVTDEQYRLAWDLSIYLLDSTHYYSVRIDAQNGSVLETHDWVLHCDFGQGNHQHNTAESVLFNTEATSMAPLEEPLDIVYSRFRTAVHSMGRMNLLSILMPSTQLHHHLDGTIPMVLLDPNILTREEITSTLRKTSMEITERVLHQKEDLV